MALVIGYTTTIAGSESSDIAEGMGAFKWETNSVVHSTADPLKPVISANNSTFVQIGRYCKLRPLPIHVQRYL
jgi:hypothetical protein